MPRASVAAVRGTTLAVLALGVACQFLQHTDPVFPIRYFTVDSAVLLFAVLLADLHWTRSALVRSLRGAATAGVLLSGMVYALVIAPGANDGAWFAPHDDGYVRTATILMHGVAPVLATADYLFDRRWVLSGWRLPSGAWRTALPWLAWPVSWAMTVAAVPAAHGPRVPYPFLDPHGWGDAGRVAAAGAAVLLLYLLTGVALVAVRVRVGAGLTPAAEASER